jgi:hypothetical protein
VLWPLAPSAGATLASVHAAEQEDAMTTGEAIDPRLAVVIGVGYVLAVGLVFIRSVQRQRAKLRAKRQRKGLLSRLFRR